MTETEKQQIVSLVLQALKTNSFTIEQLTAVKSLSDDMYVEISGGRKILVQDLTDAISAYINKDLEDFKNRITDAEKSITEGDAELLKRILGTSTKSNPLTDPFKSLGTIDSLANLKSKLNSLYEGNSSVGNYRCVFAPGSTSIPLNIQVERLGLNNVYQSFTSCIQLDAMNNSTATEVTVGPVITLSRSGVVSSGNTTWGKWMSTEAKLQEALGTKETSKSDDGSVWGELKKLLAAINVCGSIVIDLDFLNDLRDLDEVFGTAGLFTYRYNEDERNEFKDIKGLLATTILDENIYEQIRYECGFVYQRQRKNGEWGSWRITSVTDYNVSLYHVDPSDNTNRFTLDKAIYLVPIELRNIGIKCSFLDKVGKYHTYVYVGSDYVPDSWNEVNTYEDAKGKGYKGTEEDFYKNLSNIDMLHFFNTVLYTDIDSVVNSGYYIVADADTYSSDILVVSRYGEDDAITQIFLSTYYTGGVLKQRKMTGEKWSEWEEISGGSGSGSGFYNVTKLHPLNTGFYTKETAVTAVSGAKVKDEEKPGMIITFEESAGKWKDYRFESNDITAFDQPAAWNEYGGAGAVKEITFNGEKHTPDESGGVSFNVEIPQTDESLDANSTNAIQNAPVTAKFNEIEANTVFTLESEVDEDNNTVKLSLKNKSGAEIASTEFQGGTGGGGGETGTATKIVLNASVDNSIIKEGGSSHLTYFYDHQYSSGDDKGESTGQKATLTIQMLRGAQTVYTETINDVSKGTYTLDLSKYLLLGTTDIYVKATTTDPEGKKQTKQAYTSVKVITLSLSSTYNIASPVGGYAAGATASIPFTISGTGNKVVMLYVDGVQKDSKTITKSGQTNSSFSISMSDLLPGRHTVQMVAEMEASADLTVRSESIYLDIFKEGSSAPSIGMMHRFPDGRIFTDDHLTPRLEVGQYEKLQFDFVVYDPSKTPAEMSVYNNGTKTQTVSVPRTVQVYTNRFTEQGEYAMRFSCGNTEYDFLVHVAKSSIDIEEVQADLDLKLSAAGRSNTEENPAVWTDGEVTTKFTGFDWNSNGWTGDSLQLTNGATIEILKQPLANDAVSNGATYEFELKCSNVTDRNGVILSCMSGGIGFQMTTQEAKITASGGSSVNTLFASDLNLKIAFVIGKKSGTRLIELYVNGIRCGAKQYSQTESMKQEAPVNITVSSDAADIELRNLRIYRRGLTDDEELTNYMVDRPTSEEMVVLFQKNDVMNDDGSDVDIEKLRVQGKSVMRFVGDVELVNATNNKKFEVPVDVYFYSAYGKEYDFVLRNAGLRIQGTSSTTYPRKNYRIYFERFDKYGTTLEVNGVDVPDLMYSFKPGAKRVGIFCLKADFSDSSSTHNTGGVRLVNDTWKKCGWLTPPQEIDGSVRIGVDGFPMDLFYDNDNTGVNTYLGKYNFNNEKSDSHNVYGFEGIAGFNDLAALNGDRNKCICLEFLNNSHPLCLFGTSNITAENFADGLEFRFKPDKTWEDADQEDKDAVTRLWTWINSVKNDPARFRAECADYFNVNSLFGWYIITDYLMAVDSRAKNMMFCTWDGVHWYILPYDMDTILGGRNDSVLKYDYTMTWETFDDSIGSYAMAGHDSILWKLVRSWPEKLQEVAGNIRSNMSTEYVLDIFNNQLMGNWCERIYNKDGEYKYIKPLTEGVTTSEGTKYYDYLYALQGSRYAHRTFTIQNRFALLDSQYLAGTYRQDSFPIYFGYKFSTDKRKVKITASERYYFGYGYTSGEPKQSGVLAEDAGSIVELTLDTDLIVNDPQYFYGASRMLGLDLTNVSHAIVGTLNLSNCVALRVLNISCSATQKTMNALLVDKCKNLRELNLTGLQSENFTSMDLSSNSKLETFRAGKSALTGVSFAPGSPLSVAVLPATLQTLELRYLNKLSNDNLTLEGTVNTNRLVVDSCALIDWQRLLTACPAVRYLRITGIDMEGDGTLIRNLMEMGGVDENGGNVSSCRLVGTYRLTRSMTDEEYEAAVAHFPELTIIQPKYTMIEFDDTVADDANISNLDNLTGYKYGNSYVANGHITKILAKRHRVLGKQTEKGKMVICNLHDENSNYYADSEKISGATPAKLDSTEGDLWMYEPHYWYKGINDYLNNKKYTCYSSNTEIPDIPVCDKVYLSNIRESGLYKEKSKILIGRATLTDSYSSDTNYSVCGVDVSKHKRVRFPTTLGTGLIGSIFVDASGNVIKDLTVPSLNNKFAEGMYLIADVPERAAFLYFTIFNNAEFDLVVLSNSDKIEDMEPDWVEHLPCLTGVGEAISIGNSLYSAFNTSASVGSMSQSDFHYYAQQRNLQLVDWEMHKDVANLFYAAYGRRDAQDQCGYGQNTNNRIVGTTAVIGMQDTVSYDSDGVHKTEYSWYISKDADGRIVHTRIPSSNCMGYESWYGDKYEWMDKVGLPNTNAQEQYKLNIEMPDGTVRKVRSGTTGGFATGMVHQKYCDVIAAFSQAGSSTTYYCDEFQPSAAASRVVFRSHSHASPYGGVSCANCGYDSSYASAFYGSRLAFRGQIEVAESVEAYKSLKSES